MDTQRQRELLARLAAHLADEIWSEWHGPLAKIPQGNQACIASLLEMLNRFEWAAGESPAPAPQDKHEMHYQGCKCGYVLGDHYCPTGRGTFVGESAAPAGTPAPEKCLICGRTEEEHRMAHQKCDIRHAFSTNPWPAEAHSESRPAPSVAPPQELKSAEEWLAGTMFTDSQPHSSVEIAILMEAYHQYRNNGDSVSASRTNTREPK